MVRTVRICVLLRTEDEIFVVDASAESIRSRWHAHRVMTALRAKLLLTQLAAEIVVLTGDGAERNAFGSSAQAEAFIRRLMPQLSDYKWRTRELDW